ncbi:MAG: alanine racemase [Pseudomonadota bacterium]|nr:alanine racemase [Pseudomonadota bacterium]
MTLPDPAALALLVDGRLRGGPFSDEPLRGVVIDSRRARPGEVFFALGGRHADGHGFVAAALRAGAAVAIVRAGWVPPLSADGTAWDPPRIEVDAPLAALQRLAAWHRGRAIGRVVAITGSNGKTVVKDALTALLSTRYRVAASPGSWNSQIGVPLAVLAAPMGTEIGVFEAGVSEPGEMDAIAAVLKPDAGVLTNIGLAHIAQFGTREATAREKVRLFHGIPASGWALLPDDPVIDTAPLRCAVVHPTAGAPRLVARVSTPTGTLLTVAFPGEHGEVHVQIPVRTRSAPLLDDLLLAMAAATRFGVSPTEIASILQDYSFGPTRMETWRTPDGVTIVNDATSSDPLSVQAALETVASSPEARGKRIFVFGGMRELGERDEQEHALIGRLAAEKGFTHLVLLPHASLRHTAAAWRAVHPDAPVIEVANVDEIRDTVRPLAQAGDILLVKGPRNEGLAAAAREIWESMSPRRFLVDLGAIRENIARFRRRCGPGVAILAMLKAWAYGTELARVATSLQESGVDWIGVSAADEGAFARRAGVHLPILVTLLDIEEVDKVVRYRLTPVVYSMALARSLTDALRAMNATCDVHLEIDTGMGRLGVSPGEALAAARLIRASGVLRLTGLMTHLSSADDPAADAYTEAQLASFDTVVTAIRAEGDEPLVIHASATSGAARFPGARYDMVRLGLGLYGIYPSPAVAQSMELQLAVAFVSRIAQIATWPRGQRVGYNGTYTIDVDELRVGIVEAGYHDGVPWRLSNQGSVRVHGTSARILGRVSMDSMAIDLSGVPDAVVGDEVLLFGAHDGQVLRPEDVAAQAGTMPYELLVKVDSRRVQRVFVGD